MSKQKVYYISKNKIVEATIAFELVRDKETLYHLSTGLNVTKDILFDSPESLCLGLINQFVHRNDPIEEK